MPRNLREFLSAACEMGYLAPQKADEISRLCSHADFAGNAAQILMQKGWLTSEQIARVSSRISRGDTTRVQPASDKPEDAKPWPRMPDTTCGSGASGHADSESAGPKIQVGAVWRDFEILERIGAGGMGSVYKVRQVGTGRILALKLMNPSEISEQNRRRFVKEAELNYQLDHPNIVKVYLHNIHKDILFIAMQYVDGVSFRERLCESPPLRESLSVVERIARALDCAHGRNIIHRDIKPANILLDREGRPYLADFGLARSTRLEDRKLTKTGEVLGTPHYMSPEQARGQRRDIDARSDIYSLGAVLYEVATGRPPVSGNSVPEVLCNVVSSNPVLPSIVRKDVPKALEAIVCQAMAKRKEMRYRTAGELADDIARFLDGAPVRARHPGWRLLAKRLLALSAGVLVLALLAVLFAFLWPRSDPTEELRRMLAKDAGELMKEAQEAADRGDFERALDRLKHLSARDPRSRSAVSLETEIFARKGDWDKVRMCWARWSELDLDAYELESLGRSALGSGYFQDARKYLGMALEKSPDMGCRILLGQTLMHLGEYREAESIFLALDAVSPDNPEVLLGRATIHLWRRNSQSAMDSLSRASAMPDLSPLIRSRIAILQGIALWNSMSLDLNRWYWICGTSEIPACKAVDSTLFDIERKMGEALAGIAGIGSEAEKRLHGILPEQVEFYLAAISLERGTWDREKFDGRMRSFRRDFENMALPLSLREFLEQVMVRALLRKGDWKAAEELCDESLWNFPWVGNFYHLRALAKFQSGEFVDAREDIFREVGMEPTNFIPVENLVHLLLDRFTQEESDEFLNIFISYANELNPNVEAVLFRSHLEELIQIHFERRAPRQNRENQDGRWKNLLEAALRSDSSYAREFAVGALGEQHANPELRAELAHLRAKGLEAGVLQSLENVEDALEQAERAEKIDSLKSLLLRHSMSWGEQYSGDSCGDRYLDEVRNMGEQGEKLLEEILSDSGETPMIRFLAARMMVSAKTLRAWEAISEIARSETYPENMLALTAVRSMQFPAPIPKNLGKALAAMSDEKDPRFIHGQDSVYQALAGFYLVGGELDELVRVLLRSPDERASLCAAHNSRWYMRPLPEDDVVAAFLRCIENPSSPFQGRATLLFWHVKSLPDREQDKRVAIYCDYWTKHGETVAKGLESNRSDTVINTLHSIICSKYIKFYTRESRSQENPAIPKVLEILTRYSHAPDHFLRFWSSMALSVADKEQVRVWEILQDPESEFFVRLFSIYGIMDTIWMREHGKSYLSDPSKQIKMFQYLKKKASQTALTENDLRFQQASLLLLARARSFSGLFGVDVYTVSKEILNSVDSSKALRRTAIASMGWYGNAFDIQKVEPYLEDQEINVRRAAAACMACLIEQYRRKEMPKLQKSLENAPLTLRKAAAAGCYSLVENKVAPITDVITTPSIVYNYEFYLQVFREKCGAESLPALLDASVFHPNPRYAYEAALLYAKKGDIESALEQTERIRAKLPEQPTSKERYFGVKGGILQAELYGRLGKNGRAGKQLQELLENYPANAEAHLALGFWYAENGEKHGYKQHLWLAFLCDPEYVMKRLAEKTNSELIPILQKIDLRFPLTQEYLHMHLGRPVRYFE